MRYMLALLLAGCATVAPKMPPAEAGLPPQPLAVRELNLLVHARLPHLRLKEMALGTSIDYLVQGVPPSGSGQIICTTSTSAAGWQSPSTCFGATQTWGITALSLSQVGSSTTTPATIDFGTSVAGNAFRAFDHYQIAFGDRPQWYGYHGFEIWGAQATTTPPAFAAGGGTADWALEIHGGGANVLKVDGATTISGGLLTALNGITSTAGTTTLGTTTVTGLTASAGLTSTAGTTALGTTTIAGTASSSVASGSNAFAATVNGARVDFGAGATDYASSDGTTVTFAGPLASASTVQGTVLQLSASLLAPVVTATSSGATTNQQGIEVGTKSFAASTAASVTFSPAFTTSAPICVCSETTGTVAVKCSATTTTLTLTEAVSSSNTAAYICVGRK